MFFGKFTGKPDTVSLNDDIHIQVVKFQKDVPDQPAHKIDAVSERIGNIPEFSQKGDHPFRQTFFEHAGKIPFSDYRTAFLAVEEGIRDQRVAHQDVQKIRSGDNPFHLFVFNHRKDSQSAANNQILDLFEGRIRMNGGEFNVHVVAHVSVSESEVSRFFNNLPGDVTQKIVIIHHHQYIDIVTGHVIGRFVNTVCGTNSDDR